MITVYLRHSASVLDGNSGALEDLKLEGQIGAPINATGEASAPPEKKRGRPKKDKKDKDPNAPKRPLTAAFLYSQQARAIVKEEFDSRLKPGEKLEGNAVNHELNRRWAEMPEDEKEVSKPLLTSSLFRSPLLTCVASSGETPTVTALKSTMPRWPSTTRRKVSSIMYPRWKERLTMQTRAPSPRTWSHPPLMTATRTLLLVRKRLLPQWQHRSPASGRRLRRLTA